MNREIKRGSDGIFLNKYNLSVCSGEDFYNLQSILDRLATYEDTGLEPEEIEDLKDCIEGEEGTQGTVKDLLELVQYRKLEEQGLLIKLPCKVGDIFYINIQKQTYECKISGFYISKDEIQLMVAFQDEDSKTWYEIGETHKKEDLFLTREEAEKALNKEE